MRHFVLTTSGDGYFAVQKWIFGLKARYWDNMWNRPNPICINFTLDETMDQLGKSLSETKISEFNKKYTQHFAMIGQITL